MLTSSCTGEPEQKFQKSKTRETWTRALTVLGVNAENLVQITEGWTPKPYSTADREANNREHNNKKKTIALSPVETR